MIIGVDNDGSMAGGRAGGRVGQHERGPGRCRVERMGRNALVLKEGFDGLDDRWVSTTQRRHCDEDRIVRKKEKGEKGGNGSER
jgi:hypothetical protein